MKADFTDDVSGQQFGVMTEEEMIDILLHHAMGIEKVHFETGLSIDEIMEIAFRNNVEECPTCNWFFYSASFIDDDCNVCEECEECRPNEDEE